MTRYSVCELLAEVAHGQYYRKTTRQTAHHLDDFPKHVTIVRERHPFEGMVLEVLGWCRRRGELHLTLVLPDETRALIPAAWTDLPASRQSSPGARRTQPASLASRSELLHARTVVDALLRQLGTANTGQPPTPRENSDAAAEFSRSTAVTGRPRARLGHARRGAAGRPREEARPTDRQNNRPHTRRARR